MVKNFRDLEKLCIRITSNCNHSCEFCIFDSNIGDLDFNQFNRSLKILLKTNIYKISITGGEPTMHPRFTDILKLCSNNFEVVNLYTNGTFIKHNQFKSISDYIHSTYISIQADTLDKNLNSKVIDSAKKLIGLGNNVFLTTVVNKQNLNKIKEVVELGDNIRVRGIKFMRYMPCGTEEYNQENILTENESMYVGNIIDNLNKISGLELRYINTYIKSYHILQPDLSISIENGNCKNNKVLQNIFSIAG